MCRLTQQGTMIVLMVEFHRTQNLTSWKTRVRIAVVQTQAHLLLNSLNRLKILIRKCGHSMVLTCHPTQTTWRLGPALSRTFQLRVHMYQYRPTYQLVHIRALSRQQITALVLMYRQIVMSVRKRLWLGELRVQSVMAMCHGRPHSRLRNWFNWICSLHVAWCFVQTVWGRTLLYWLFICGDVS